MSPTVGWLRDRPHGDRLGLCYLFVTPLNRPDKRGWKQRMQLLLATFSCLPQMVEMVGARGFHSAVPSVAGLLSKPRVACPIVCLGMLTADDPDPSVHSVHAAHRDFCH